jgi:phosphoadenosine phosphosulfate reductase
MEIRSRELLDKKVEDSKKVIREAYAKYDPDRMAMAWTGGKDSTLLLWLVKELCEEAGWKLPICFTIDEGDMFGEVRQFIDQISNKWNVQVTFVHNKNVSDAASGKLGAMVQVSELNERNRRELTRLGFEENEFPYEPESFIGNHLMKTVPLNEFLEKEGIEAFFEGIRWDEQEARAYETYFSPRKATEYNPDHMRVFPILHFLEREVWEAYFAYDIPICKLYKKGYRSLGARSTTTKTTDIPAWEQELDKTSERGGRRQDKEGLMKKLRELGYM